MADKYLYNNAGQVTERELTVSSAGAGDAGKGVALDGTGKLDNSTMPVGVGADTKALTATEALASGDFVNVYASTGAKCRKADATTNKPAHGFVLAAVDQDATATGYFEGTNTQLTGLTAGSPYFLSTSAGGVTVTAPSASGNIVQRVGVAVSDTEISFEPGDAVLLA